MLNKDGHRDRLNYEQENVVPECQSQKPKDFGDDEFRGTGNKTSQKHWRK
jgi:hypothetical protein